jgi:hypothetical protein
VKIQTINGFLSELKKIKIGNDTRLFFRGEARKHDHLIPSIYREKNGKQLWIGNEDRMFKEYILRNPNEFTHEKTTFEKLVKMQHYSLPTRLLDITSNPLVALFNSCCKYSDKKKGADGTIFVLRVLEKQIKFFDSDTVSVVANISRRPVNKLNVSGWDKLSSENDKQFITRFNSENDDIGYLLHEIKEEKPYFLPLVKKEHLENVWCVKPLLKNPRIIKQDGAFLLFGINGDKFHCADIPPEIQVDELVIQRGYKGSIIRDLEVIGISQDKLYPELDTTAEFLKDKLQCK